MHAKRAKMRFTGRFGGEEIEGFLAGIDLFFLALPFIVGDV